MNKIEPAPPRLTPDLIGRFAAIVGEKYAVTDQHDIAPYVTEERMLYRGHTQLVLRPGTTAEVAAIARLANETRTALVPQGGNTGLVGGQTPHHGELVVSLRRMDRVRDLDTNSNTMICEAGVVLLNAQQRASDADRLFPLSLGAEGSCTIGGNLSTNAGGTSALAYGVARDLVLGLEVVLADGRILNALTKLKKDNTGYNLHNLFVGAEGTLGIITAAVLKLFPKPRSVETAFIGLKSPQDALALLGVARAEAAGSVTSFELIPEIAIDFCVRHGDGIRDPMTSRHPWYVLMELTSQAPSLSETMETILSRGLEEGLVDDAVIATSLEHRRAFWLLREFVSASQKPEGGSIKHDVSVPVASVPEFLEKASAAVVKLHARRARGGLRPSRRRQHPLQCQPAHRRRQGGVPELMACRERRGARHRRRVRRLDLGRARHRLHEARRACACEGPGRNAADAAIEGDARPERDSQSGEGRLALGEA